MTCSARPTASKASATSRAPAPTTRRRGRVTRKRCRSIAASATCSARPTASGASATSRSTAPSTTRRGRATRKPCRSFAASATCSARPTASRVSATSRSPRRARDGAGMLRGSPAALSPRRRLVGEAICFAMLGRLARVMGDHTTARTHFMAAVSTFRRVGARQNEAVALEDLASVTLGPERDGHLQAHGTFGSRQTSRNRLRA